jgi:hypothetical protein
MFGVIQTINAFPTSNQIGCKEMAYVMAINNAAFYLQVDSRLSLSSSVSPRHARLLTNLLIHTGDLP